MKRLQALFPGLIPVALISVLSFAASRHAALAPLGLGPLPLAIVLGTAVGNLRPCLTHGRYQDGLKFSQSRLLRIGVALYGFNLSLQQVMEVGAPGILIDVLMVASTLLAGWLIGTRFFHLDKETALLTAAGSAICGAAAIVATAPLLRMPHDKSAQATASAVSTVVLFGSLAMLLYPALYALSGSEQSAFGLYVGSTVHEVAQVVAIGNMIGENAAHAAIIAKMLRVLLLIPFLFGLSAIFCRKTGQQKISVPWFALAFLLLVVINSLPLVPAEASAFLRHSGMILLTAAMAALGMDTRIERLRQGGLKTLGLGLCLFAHLIFIGGLINNWISR